jgi:hypothetical protein
MTTVGRAAAVIAILAAVAAAAPFAPGTRFGTVGADYHFSSGDLYTYSHDSQYVKIDPFFRVGIAALSNMVVGAELALFNTFPDNGDMFLNTPVFAFCPTATLYPSLGTDVFLPYVTAGAGATYAFVWDRVGWRAKLAAGAAIVSNHSVALALEGGWYGDWGQYRRWNSSSHHYELTWIRGSSGFIGVRVIGFKR